MYQLYHGITDTKRSFTASLLNELFFGAFLKRQATIAYGTLGASAERSEKSGKVGNPAGAFVLAFTGSPAQAPVKTTGKLHSHPENV